MSYRELSLPVVRAALCCAVTMLVVGCGGSSGSDTAPSTGSEAPSPPPPSTFGLSGSVSGLSGGTLVLQVNNSSNVSVTSNGTVTLATGLASGSNYSVVVLTQPGTPAQNCTVSNGSGTIAGAAVSNVGVTCVALPPLTLTSSTPANGAKDVPASSAINLKFSVPLATTPDPVSLMTLTAQLGKNPATLTSNVLGTELTLVATEPLALLRRHSLAISGALRGALGEQPTAPWTIDFQTADGKWQSPVSVDGAGSGTTVVSRFVRNSSGHGIVLWYNDAAGPVTWWFNQYDATTRKWGLPQRVTALGSYAGDIPSLAIAESGDALLAWAEQGKVFSSQFAASAKTWSAAQLLAQGVGSATDPVEVVISRDGTALAVWREFGGGTYSLAWNRYTPRTGWQPQAAGVIAAGIVGFLSEFDLAMDDAGNAMVIWTENISGAPSTARASYFSIASNAWDTPSGFGAGSAVSYPTLTADAAGSLFAVWVERDTALDAVRFNRFTPGKGWESPTYINDQMRARIGAQAGNALLVTSTPRIAVDAQGGILILWPENLGQGEDLWVNQLVPSLGWRGARKIEENDTGAATGAQLAIDAAGNALVIWEQVTLTGEPSIWSARFIAESGWQPAVVVATDPAGILRSPRLQMDPSGRAWALWVGSSAGVEIVRGSAFE